MRLRDKLIKKTQDIILDLGKYYKETENSEIPDVGTTIIGYGGTITYKIRRSVIVRTEIDGMDDFIDTFRLGCDMELEELEEQIKHDRRRLAKGWRVWKSENPDVELEKDMED